VATVRTDVSEESRDSIIWVSVDNLGTTLALNSNGLKLRRNRHCVTLKRRFLQEPYGVTSQKTAFFIVTAMFLMLVPYMEFISLITYSDCTLIVLLIDVEVLKCL
jgi:hypothetical protein